MSASDSNESDKHILWFADCNYKNKSLVGGKNSSLGELYHHSQIYNFKIANGFAITTKMYQEFIEHNKIDEDIECLIKELGTETDMNKTYKTASFIQELFKKCVFTGSQKKEIEEYYRLLGELYQNTDLSVAVRSSAVVEDLPNASFAGQQDTYLNISGIEEVYQKVKECFASLFNTRAISYRQTHRISFRDVLISVGIQKMIRSDLGSAGVAFSLDPETGYDKAIVINSSYGLGELVVSGGVKPDEIVVDKRTLPIMDSDPIVMKNLGDKKTKIVYSETGVKEVATTHLEKVDFSLSNKDAVDLAKTVYQLEKLYRELFKKELGIDVEWALDGQDQQMYIIQTRPETVHSNKSGETDCCKLVSYHLESNRSDLTVLLSGVAVGEKISTGRIRVLDDISRYREFQKGEILVTDMTTPDWEPIMKISSGIITNKGGRTCHAAIVAREMGLNAIVRTGNATTVFSADSEWEKVDGTEEGDEGSEEDKGWVTMDCANGEVGKIYPGRVAFQEKRFTIDTTKKLPIKLMLNVGSPENAFSASLVQKQKGVGLARLEFIITNYVQIHPLALSDYPEVHPNDKNGQVRDRIRDIIGSHDNGRWYFIKRLARGIAKIASAFYPHDVIVRLSDFKSNEYRNLLGGHLYEPSEENPMIGWRGASRYYSKEYQRGFKLECEAIKYVRDVMKLTNTMVMIPFCRTPEECSKVTGLLEQYGLHRGQNGLKFILMCEIPSNVIEADHFSPYIDGVSIGGNDLLQLTLGIDRDSEMVTEVSNDKNVSYRRMIKKGNYRLSPGRKNGRILWSTTLGQCGIL